MKIKNCGLYQIQEIAKEFRNNFNKMLNLKEKVLDSIISTTDVEH